MTDHSAPVTDPAGTPTITLPPLPKPCRVGVLISGGGRTLLNLDGLRAEGMLPIEIPLVIASRPDCVGIERARQRGLICETLRRTDHPDSETHSAAIFARLREEKCDLVCLAGWLSLLSIPEDFRFRVLNIHPSLIPAFCGRGYYGEHVHRAAIDRGVKFSGCTVHFANPEYDEGPVVVQRVVPVEDDDTPDTLAARVFQAECAAYPEALHLVISGGLRVRGQRVRPALDS